mgnify:CR=1 FL=1
MITLLPDHVANQIAAGEVVQRPSSAVKELIENAMDAKSKDIKLVIIDSGKTMIQVIDDGTGMNEADAKMCFERHATSKISKADDLFALQTKGFRGEALASIAAIAQIELKTKLDNWLTERYALFQDAKKYINQYEIHHLPWLVYDVDLNNLKCDYPRFNNLLKKEPVKIQYSKGVQVITWGKNKIKK